MHASWINQVELYFSIIQRKVLTPNDCASLDELIERIVAFGKGYSALDKPFLSGASPDKTWSVA